MNHCLSVCFVIINRRNESLGLRDVLEMLHAKQIMLNQIMLVGEDELLVELM